MKQLFIIMAFLLVGTTSFAQEEEKALEPTQLGQWTRPAATSIDAYVAHCAVMYQEAMNIRALFDAVEQIDITAVANEMLGIEDEDEFSVKKAAYEAVIARILQQQEAAAKLPELFAAATSSLRRAGLRAPAGTRAIAATREVAVLIIRENANLLVATQAKLAELTGVAPAEAEDTE